MRVMGGILWSLGWIQMDKNVGGAGRQREGHRVRSGGASEVNMHGQMWRRVKAEGNAVREWGDSSLPRPSLPPFLLE